MIMVIWPYGWASHHHSSLTSPIMDNERWPQVYRLRFLFFFSLSATASIPLTKGARVMWITSRAEAIISWSGTLKSDHWFVLCLENLLKHRTELMCKILLCQNRQFSIGSHEILTTNTIWIYMFWCAGVKCPKALLTISNFIAILNSYLWN